MTQYLALLRGINVGGKNIIKMSELKDCFEDLGLENVFTYIQSGNVIFTSKKNKVSLHRSIEKTLSAQFNFEASLALRSQAELQKIIKTAPKGFGSQPSKYRYDVLFLMNSLSASKAIHEIPTKPGVDKVNAGIDALYFSRLISKASQSRLSRVVSMPIYQEMTIRNWNTTTKLLSLMESAGTLY